MNPEIIPAYSAYQEVIDLTLYHAFVELIVQTAQDDDARILYRQMKARQIWQKDQNVSGYFETYNLRYPGEVLERFEEKLGADMRILRALALALGYTRQCQADTMFVGNQRIDFLQKLRRTAGTDVYLQGALYLLESDAPQRRARLEELAAREYARTEEVLFVVSGADKYTVCVALLDLFGNIKHTFTSVRDADEIIVITEDGIAERGTHEELLDMNGVYAAYYNM